MHPLSLEERDVRKNIWKSIITRGKTSGIKLEYRLTLKERYLKFNKRKITKKTYFNIIKVLKNSFLVSSETDLALSQRPNLYSFVSLNLRITFKVPSLEP